MRFLILLLSCFTFAPALAQQESISMLVDGRILVGPDPNVATELVSILGKVSVIDELQISDDAQNALKQELARMRDEASSLTRSVLHEKKGSTDDIKLLRETHNAELKGLLEELFTPDQRTRLVQLAYRIEISRRGYEAIATGRLSDAIGVHEQQRSILSRKIANFEVELEKKVMELRLEFEQQILAELTPEQRRKATDLLGPPFNYNDMDEEITSFKQKFEELKSRKAGK